MAETLADMEAYHQENTKYITRDRSLDFLETLADMATVLEDVRGQKYFVLFSEGIDQSFFEDYTNTLGNRRLAETLKSFRRSGWVMQSVNVTRQSFDETEWNHYGARNVRPGLRDRGSGVSRLQPPR